MFLLITDLQDTTLALDFRVSVLEDNGGDEGNSSVGELEVRVEILEGTAADHETRISTTELDINGKDAISGRNFNTKSEGQGGRLLTCEPEVEMCLIMGVINSNISKYV